MTGRIKWASGAVASLTVMSLALTGCGSDSKTKTKPAAAAPAANPSLTKSEIKIGLIISQTGTSASSDKSGVDSAQAWEKWINAGTGIAGHPVKLIIKDDKGDPATAVAAAKELVGDGVVSISLQTSNTEVPSNAYLKTQNIPVIGATGYAPQVWGATPNYFGTAPGAISIVQAQFAAAKAVGASHWSSAYCAEVAACKASEPMYKPASAQQGITYAGSFAVAATAPNYTAECLKLNQLKTDFLQIAINPASAKRLVADCGTQSYKGWYGASAGSVGADLTGIKDIRLAGALQGFPWWAQEAPAATFRDAMTKYAPGVDYANPGTTAVWTALELTHKALANAGDTVTAQTVFDGLYGLKDETLGGLLPQPLTFTKGTPPAANNCVWLYKMENGTFASAATGDSGNGATGDLKSTCMKPLGG
jgi:branched-chain amino acid transport system substrate-binding protein